MNTGTGGSLVLADMILVTQNKKQDIQLMRTFLLKSAFRPEVLDKTAEETEPTQ